MTVAELIEKLKELPQDMEVQYRNTSQDKYGFILWECYNIDYVSIINNIVILERL